MVERQGSHSEEAVLYSTQDVPLYKAVNLYRKDPYRRGGGYQSVVASYEQPVIWRVVRVPC